MRESKTVLITGGSKGIGFTLAQIFARKKYNIVICSRNSVEIKKAKRKLEAYGINCLALETDISNFYECKQLIEKAVQKFSRIDVLVNNAGVQGPIDKTWLTDSKKWEETVDINLLGTFYMCRVTIPYMLKQKSGIIINVAGGGSVYPRPYFSAYAVSKTSILKLTETLALELSGKNVFVFAIGPGLTWTDMAKMTYKGKKVYLKGDELKKYKNAMKTGGTPVEKMENLVTFLLNKKSKRFSGRLIHVNELEAIKKAKLNIKQDGGFLRRVEYF